VQKRTRNRFIGGIVAGLALVTLSLTVFGPQVRDYFSELALFNQNEVVVVTHDSAAFPQELLDEFKAETGLTVTQLKAGDTGSMVNKLVLTKDAPIGDMVYGIDNTFSAVALENNILDKLPAAETDKYLEEINFADVCINYDKEWFSINEIAPPKTIADLTKPAYQGLTVLTNPTTSSPGLAFLASTVAIFGDAGWQQYWQALKLNDVKIASGWEDAYFTDFSGSSGKGAYPIVLSYTTSPAFEIRDNGESQTASFLNDCFRQREFAGILSGAKNPTGAQKFITFMTQLRFQEALPDSNYVYPVLAEAKLPDTWTDFAPPAKTTVGAELQIDASRKTWFTQWGQIFDAN